MGRRKRPRQEDEGDELESYERKWLLYREKGSGRQQVAVNDVKANEAKSATNNSSFVDDKKPPSNVSESCCSLHVKI